MPIPPAPELNPETLARHRFRARLGILVDSAPPEGSPPLGVCPPRECASSPLIPQGPSSRVLARATAEWRLEVREPPGRGWQRIDEYIRGPEGLGWPSAALSGSNDSKSYTRNLQFQWCGAFAAFCHSEVDADLRKHHFASVYRLDQWSRGNARRIAPSDLIPGDIVIVGPKTAGAHVTICLAIPSRLTTIETIEGNATGAGPGGEKFEGVIHRQRPLTSADPREYRVHFGVRPQPEDMDGR